MKSRTPEREWAGLAEGGAAVAVGVGEVFYGLAADEVVFQLAVDDDIDGLGGDAFVVDGVGADEILAVEGLERGSSVTLRKSGSTEAWSDGGVGALGAGGGAHLGAVGLDVGNEEAVEDIGGGVAGEEDGAVVVVGGDDGGVAQSVEAIEIIDACACGRLGAFEVLGSRLRRCRCRGRDACRRRPGRRR